jgi:hypothetical protein
VAGLATGSGVADGVGVSAVGGGAGSADGILAGGLAAAWESGAGVWGWCRTHPAESTNSKTTTEPTRIRLLLVNDHAR